MDWRGVVPKYPFCLFRRYILRYRLKKQGVVIKDGRVLGEDSTVQGPAERHPSRATLDGGAAADDLEAPGGVGQLPGAGLERQNGAGQVGYDVVETVGKALAEMPDEGARDQDAGDVRQESPPPLDRFWTSLKVAGRSKGTLSEYRYDYQFWTARALDLGKTDSVG